MLRSSALMWLNRFQASWLWKPFSRSPTARSNLTTLAQLPIDQLPDFVRTSDVALKYVRLLGLLDWHHFPDRPDQRFAPDCPPLSHASVVAAYLVKLDQHLAYVADLRDYLVEHPALVWVLGFPLVASDAFAWGFDVQASLPTHRHLSRLLRTIPNARLAALLDETVGLIQTDVADVLDPDAVFGDCIALDTKHVIAWVKENNPKAYVTGRFDKARQPAGDPDCRLGCKRKTNQRAKPTTVEDLPTPHTNPVPAAHLEIGEYYWGYGSGIVATQVADWGEFVLAELTQPFDQPDVSYFAPLMAQAERRLGRRPRFGALDAAFDAFYVYDYFAQAGGFAAVPFVQRGHHRPRAFSPDGAPLCEAGLPMPARYRFQCKTTLIPHERGRYVCPLLYPTVTGQVCPIHHPKWDTGGCVATLATSPGARLRYQVDRESEPYQAVYKQRTATERLNSQAVALGIERPKLRNGASIANHNTLTYVLINLHALQRLRQRKAERSSGPTR